MSYLEERCSVCKTTDDHPKFHLVGPSNEGLGWDSMHHDCAATQGYEHADLIVKASNGAKGDDLRAILADPDHEVHAIVQKSIDDHYAASLKENK